MSLKLKALGLGLLAVLATSAFAVMNASATVNGHFTHDASGGHATIIGEEIYGSNPKHYLEFQRTEPTGTKVGPPIACTEATYHGTVSSATTDSITVTPTYKNCATTDGIWGEVEVTMNGCDYTFRSNSAASTHTPTADATVTIDCEPGKAIVIDHPNCTITVDPQTPKGGVTYTTITEKVGGVDKHAITINVTATHIVGTFHGGICVFLGTTKEFDMEGAATVRGFDTNGNQINITAT